MARTIPPKKAAPVKPEPPMPKGKWLDQMYGNGKVWRTKLGTHTIQWMRGEGDGLYSSFWVIRLFNGELEFQTPKGTDITQAMLQAEEELRKYCSMMVQRLGG